MLEDSDRLLHTIDQVLRAGATGSRLRRIARVRLEPRARSRASAWSSRARAFISVPRRSRSSSRPATEPIVLGDGDELKAAVSNLIDNAVKYSLGGDVRVQVELEEVDNQRVAVRVTRPGRRHLAAGAEADLPALLPHSGERRRPHQGQRPRPLHRPIGGAPPRRPGVRRERRRRPRQHVHAPSPVGAAGIGLRHPWPARTPDRRRRAAPGRRPALQPRGGGLRRRIVETGEAALEACSTRRRAMIWSCST